MDTISRRLAKFALALKYENLSDDVLHKAKQMLLDTLGCAFGGYLSDVSKITRSVVRSLGGPEESTVIGSGEKVSCANAAMANGAMVRYLDYNDSYIAGSHPSESVPTGLAVGERERVNGKELITAIVLGYEVHCRFADVFPGIIRSKFWNTTFGSFASPVTAGKLLGLTEDQIVNAVGISGCHNITMVRYQTGTDGQMTMMKAMGYGLAAQSGINAALLAREGLTAKDDVIERFIEINGGDEADFVRVAEGEKKFKILKTGIKPYASEFMMHTWIEAGLKLQKEHAIRPDDIETIQVKTFKPAGNLMRPAAYNPTSRETADHSGPYCLAMALIEGALGPEQFAREQWKDPKVKDLMSKMKAIEDPELTKLFPPARPAIVEIRTRNGEIYTSPRVDYALGHMKNPMTDEQVQAKFRSMASGLMSERQMQNIINLVYHIEDESDTEGLMRLLIV